jgi:hypothetical protein
VLLIHLLLRPFSNALSRNSQCPLYTVAGDLRFLKVRCFVAMLSAAERGFKRRRAHSIHTHTRPAHIHIIKSCVLCAMSACKWEL